MSIKGVGQTAKNPETGLNRRQEAFCRYVVSGSTPSDAYIKAGYDVGGKGGPAFTQRTDSDSLRPAAHNLSNKLMQNPKVKKRLADLRKMQQDDVEVQREALTEKYVMDLEHMTVMLLEDRHFARTGELALRGPDGEIEDKTGPSGDWRPDARAAVQATMGLAKLHGLLIDRKEVTVIDAMKGMNNNELLEFIGRLQEQLGPVIDVPVNSDSRSDSRFSRMITAETLEEETANAGEGYE